MQPRTNFRPPPVEGNMMVHATRDRAEAIAVATALYEAGLCSALPIVSSGESDWHYVILPNALSLPNVYQGILNVALLAALSVWHGLKKG